MIRVKTQNNSKPSTKPISTAKRGINTTLAACIWLGAFAWLSPNTVYAFSIDTPLADGCHEGITGEVLRSVPWPNGATPPASSKAHEVLISNLLFEPDEDLRDPWSIAMLIGVRFADLKGARLTDFITLPQVHGEPDAQPEHCLRRSEHDFAQGDIDAITQCQQFILDMFQQALGEGESIDLTATVSAPIAFAFTGTRDIELQRYAFYVGRGLHALQDSFTHIIRSETNEVQHVLNYIDWVSTPNYNVERDGFRHITGLDDCDADGQDIDFSDPNDLDEYTKVKGAVEASIAVVQALSTPNMANSERLQRTEEALANAFQYQPGCDASNQWCDAPELAEEDPYALRCSTNSETSPHASFPLFTCLWAWFLFELKKNAIKLTKNRATQQSKVKRQYQSKIQRLMLTGVCAISCIITTSVSAEEPSNEPSQQPWGVIATLGGSLDHGGLNFSAGGRYDVSRHLTLGIDAEYNPWFSVQAVRVGRGVANFYLTASYRFPLSKTVELRTTGQLGTSLLLFDLVGASKFSVGPYLGLSLVGVGIQLEKALRLIINPAAVAIPIPHLRGTPLIYRQYRMTIGLQWNPHFG